MRPQSLLQNLEATQKVSVGCPILNNWLGGGVHCKSITEVVGESSCGKTQLCLQLSLVAQLPPTRGGLCGSSMYIHSDFTFPFRRLQQLAHYIRSSSTTNPCDNIYVHAIQDAHQLVPLIGSIEAFIEKGKTRLPVRLVIIDSIAPLFRASFDNTPSQLKRRSDLFFKISGKLKALASRFDVAVVVTNHVVDVIGPIEGMNGIRLGNLDVMWSSGRRVTPALGIAWAHCVNSRLFLSIHHPVCAPPNEITEGHAEYESTHRRLDVILSPFLPPTSCRYVIMTNGVFGLDRID